MANQSELHHLIEQLKDVPEVIRLGTPQVLHTDTIKRIIEFGEVAIPFLTACLKDGEKSQIAQAVYALAELSAVSAITELMVLRTQVQQVESKTPWDYTILGQIAVALRKLKSPSPSNTYPSDKIPNFDNQN
jgi:hypothetical protein